MIFQEGQQLGDYEIVGRLGEGESGAVYKARQGSPERIVALKFFDPSLSSDAEIVGNFLRAAAAAAMLKHPNLVEVYGVGECDGLHFVAMEFAPDESVFSWLRRKGRVGPENAIAIGLHLAAALDYAWNEAALIHGDIKLGILFVSRGGGVKLGAIGLTRDAGEIQSALSDGTVRSAAHYWSPEQVQAGADFDLRANIYSIGCVLYHMLCGRPPFDGDNAMEVAMKHASEPPPDLRKAWPACPRTLTDVIRRAMQKDPAVRFQNYGELSDALRDAYDSLGAPDAPESPPAPEVAASVAPAVSPAVARASSPLAAPVADESLPASPSSPPQPATKVKRRKPIRVWAAVAVVTCVVLGSAFYFFRWKKSGHGADADAFESPPGLPKAERKKPFVNTLGMPFVPVRGAKVLVCIWETRVKDYEAFAQSKQADDAWTKQEYRGTPVAREPGHPVCGVSWEDADAFCQWLTEKETAEGKLTGGAHYRLPTDVEWSQAVGLRSEEGGTPKERSGKNGADYPWGRAWPPHDKAGSYADAAYHEKYPKERAWIAGYSDGFAETAPVGSFAANEFGIHDLGGNVWEWCGDLYEPGKMDRVLRGASWDDSDRGYLLSSYRIHYPPASRYSDYGFRCVLAAGEARQWR